MTSALRLRRFVWVACALLLAATAEASTQTLIADFDGDGHSDSVSIDRADPSVLDITLSGSGTVARLRRARAILQIAAHDVDGDHRPELITTEASTASALSNGRALHVWKPDAQRGFRRVHPRRGPPGSIGLPVAASLDRDDPADDAGEDLGNLLPSRESLNTRDPVAPPAASASIIPAVHPDAALASVLPSDLSAPRAPPVRTLLISLLA